ncbi:MAG TPA: hypothetical protein VJC37_08850 [Planctomycetota bacterium]|nr:hypothetical protein [Planctomycetota bacterium]
MPKTQFLSKPERKAIDKLKSSYGGTKKIAQAINEKRTYESRRKVADKKGFGKFINEAEEFAKSFPKVDTFNKKNNIKVLRKGVATTQVSAWQGYKVTHNCMKRLANNGSIFLPDEMISVMPMTDEYVYGGDLLTTLAMCENIMGGKFCSTSLLGVPLPAHRFDRIKKVTGAALDTVDAGNGIKQLRMNNMGTVFGNLCGIEVGNDNHLVYLDSITRAALETGNNFFLNPSWSTITAGCYYGYDIPNLSFKISCFMGLHNLIQFRVLLGILKEFQRRDKTTPVREINLGNAINAEKFMICKDMVKAAKIKNLSLTAHIAINSDLGAKDYNWFNNALKVLDKGYDMTLKYESDGSCCSDDTVGSYFLSKEDREIKSEILGDVLYKKVLRCDQDAKKLLKLGHEVIFAEISEQ